jgi:hypothetical protein
VLLRSVGLVVLSALLVGLYTCTLPCKAVGSPPAVVWNASFGNGSCEALCITAADAGGFALGGRSRGRGLDAWLMTIDDDGGKALEKAYWWPGDNCAYAITPCRDGGFALVGTGQSPYDTAFVLKVTEDGEAAWHLDYGGRRDVWAEAEARGIAELKDGFLVVGSLSRWTKEAGMDREVVKTDAWIFMVDHEGRMAWNRTYGGWQGDYASSVTATDDGFVVTGYGRSFGPTLNAFILRLNAEGEVIWNRTFDLARYDYLYSATLDPEGHIVAVGHVAGSGALVVMVDPNGNRTWQTIHGDSRHSASSITPVPDGFLVVGTIATDQDQSSIWVLKIDREGHKLWEMMLGGDGIHRGVGIAPIQDGGFMVLGNRGIGDPQMPGELTETYPEIFVLGPEPLGSIVIDPDTVIPGVDDALMITASVSGGERPRIVWVNLSALGLPDYLPLYDDGTHGDLFAADSTYTRSAPITTAPGVPSGRLPVTIHIAWEDGKAWSTRTYCYVFPVREEVIYDENREAWSPVANNAEAHAASDSALSGNLSLLVTPSAGGSIDLVPPGGLPFDIFGYESLELSINPSQGDRMYPRLFMATPGEGIKPQIDLVEQGYSFSSGNWTQVSIPLRELGMLNQPIAYIRIGGHMPESYHLDRVILTTTIPEFLVAACLATIAALLLSRRPRWSLHRRT